MSKLNIIKLLGRTILLIIGWSIFKTSCWSSVFQSQVSIFSTQGAAPGGGGLIFNDFGGLKWKTGHQKTTFFILSDTFYLKNLFVLLNKTL